MARTISDKFQMKFLHYPRSGKLLSVLAWRVSVLEREREREREREEYVN